MHAFFDKEGIYLTYRMGYKNIKVCVGNVPRNLYTRYREIDALEMPLAASTASAAEIAEAALWSVLTSRGRCACTNHH